MNAGGEADAWITKLAKHRPPDAARLTQEVIDVAGWPPIPPITPGDASGMLDHYTVIESSAEIAKNRHDRAVLEAMRLRQAGQDDDAKRASVEASFWADVENWVRTLR
jgi:hypothetical protein